MLTAELGVTVVDDDRGIVLTPTSLSVDEGDTTGETYTVKLATQPDEAVTITVTGHSGTDLTLDKTTLTFTTSNWSMAQTVTVKGRPGRRRRGRHGDADTYGSGRELRG